MALIILTNLLAAKGTAQVATVTQISGYYVANGEFNVSPIIGGGYGPATVVNNGYQTFCLDRSVSIGIPGQYFYSVDTNGVYPPANFTLTKGTAWLFSRFASNSLPGYRYAGFATPDPGNPDVTERASDAFNLQRAIWTLEGQYWYGAGPGPLSLEEDLAHNAWLVQVADEFGGGSNGLLAAMSANHPGDYNVGALHLNALDGEGTVVQPMLVLLNPPPRPTCIGDFVWEDRNKNGVQDEGEPGIRRAIVSLTDCSGNSVAELNQSTVPPVVTDSEGYYHFGNLPPGNYKITVTLPQGYVFTRPFACDGGASPKTFIIRMTAASTAILIQRLA